MGRDRVASGLTTILIKTSILSEINLESEGSIKRQGEVDIFGHVVLSGPSEISAIGNPRFLCLTNIPSTNMGRIQNLSLDEIERPRQNASKQQNQRWLCMIPGRTSGFSCESG
jgi:hypothetical protein